MANKIEIPVGTIGGRIIVILKRQNGLRFAINGSSSKQILITKPSGAVLVKTASYVTDGSDGEIYYDLISGDVDEEDTDYVVQGKVVIGGRTFPSTKGYFDGV